MDRGLVRRKSVSPEEIERRSVPRRPLRARGVKRVEVLLDATEHLLAYSHNDDISLATIAEQAGVPLPSVYHFFPNRNAALVALAGRYHRDLANLARQPLDPEPSEWQDLIRMRQRNGARYLNRHPAALRLFMGAGVSVEVRHLDLRGNAALAVSRAEDLRQRFDCSGLLNLEFWLAVSIGIMDGIWAISYAEHGTIEDVYVAESSRAAIAYLRCFLPEQLAPRPPNAIVKR
ncbi:TetR/AcrR family transcriptional regulator [Devosia sp. ZW T5_3]|uniref:TetR/AcrR family transcriptional regulator n=1 Tax=Devosia sp. ZW T5_3 TaxID=3378085 RepID=UPI003851DF27